MKAVVDYAVTRDDVEVSRLALIGYSLGGLLASRAAAFGPRIRACIANPPTIDVGGATRAVWPAALRRGSGRLFEVLFGVIAKYNVHVRWIYHHAEWSLGIQHPHAFFEAWRRYALHGLERKLHQPLLCLVSEDEIAQTSKSMILETMQFLTAIEAPEAMRFFPRRSAAASHCQMGGLHAAQASIFDWLDDLMRLEPAPGPLCVPRELVEALKRYHGSFEADFRALLKESVGSSNAKFAAKIVMRMMGEISATAELLALYRTHLLAPRLEQLRGVVERARARKELRANLPTDIACAMIAGPLFLYCLTLLAEADVDVSSNPAEHKRAGYWADEVKLGHPEFRVTRPASEEAIRKASDVATQDERFGR